MNDNPSCKAVKCPTCAAKVGDPCTVYAIKFMFGTPMPDGCYHSTREREAEAVCDAWRKISGYLEERYNTFAQNMAMIGRAWVGVDWGFGKDSVAIFAGERGAGHELSVAEIRQFRNAGTPLMSEAGFQALKKQLVGAEYESYIGFSTDPQPGDQTIKSLEDLREQARKRLEDARIVKGIREVE